MPEPDDFSQQYLENLRSYRNRPDKDFSLGFLKKQFKRDIERPMKQLGDIGKSWQQLVPEKLAEHTRLDGLSSGVLRVSVDCSAHLYELDRLLRSGLQKELVAANPASKLRRVQLKVGQVS